MRKYLMLGKYTAEGLQAARSDTFKKREEAIKEFSAALGARIIEYGFTFGEYDFIVLAEFPDEKAAVAASLVAGSSSTVAIMTLPIMSPAELDDASAHGDQAHFKAAGQA
jgi:uncharacterized protein with GYD domain